MKRRVFTIRTEAVIDNLTAFLKSQPLEPILEVTVEEHKKDRTVAQNRLYRLWCSIIADEYGWSEKDIAKHYRKKFLIPIYERDHQGTAEMMQAVRKVYSLKAHKEALQMYDYVAERISTADAKVKQFIEYLRKIELDAAENGIVLPRPEDRYYQAMGTKKG